MSLDFTLILDEFNRRFDELETRWDRRFSSAAYIDLPPTSLSINHSSDASASAPPTPVAVIADNWGGCFDDGEQYRTRPSIVVDNWGGFFYGEDVAPSDNPTRFVLPVASTDEPSIDTAPARANSGAADDSVFVTAESSGYKEPSGYDEMDARLDLRFARLQQLQAEEVDEPYRDAVSPLPPLPVVYEPYREASHPPPVHDDVAGVVSTGSDDDLDLQQIAKEPSVSSPPRHSSRDAVRGPCPRPLHHQLTIPIAANLDQICRLSRPCDVADRGLLCDLLWSDPSSMEDREWADNKDRYVSCTFGADVATDCRRAQDLDIVYRAHQVVEDEYEFSVDRQLVTFFSAPNYRKLGCSFTIIKLKADRNSSSPLGCSTKCPSQALHPIVKPNLVVVLNIAGAGGKLCGGFDIKVFTRVHQTGDVSLMPNVSIELVSNMMEQGKQPSVAAIPGLALGGGLELTMSCQAQIPTHVAHTICSLVNNVMASQAHVVGQGIVDRAAFSGDHQWIVQGTANGHGLSSKVAAEVNNQFRVGIQTTAIIHVLPRGVLQFGSTGLALGNKKIVMFAKKLCSQLNNRSSLAASASAKNTSRQHGQSLIDNAIVSTSTPPNVLLIASLLWAAQQNGHPELIGKTPIVRPSLDVERHILLKGAFDKAEEIVLRMKQWDGTAGLVWQKDSLMVPKWFTDRLMAFLIFYSEAITALLCCALIPGLLLLELVKFTETWQGTVCWEPTILLMMRRHLYKQNELYATLFEGAMIGYTPGGMQFAQETIETMISSNLFLIAEMANTLSPWPWFNCVQECVLWQFDLLDISALHASRIGFSFVIILTESIKVLKMLLVDQGAAGHFFVMICDPGGIDAMYRLEGKPNFKKGRMSVARHLNHEPLSLSQQGSWTKTSK
jgi:diadenosine tetraphosphatase ApaH/serine/threonine PP2A family protein phosphatase